MPDQVTGEEDRPDADRCRLVGEVGEDLRRADPGGVAGRLAGGVLRGVDQLRQPGFQRTVGSSAGVEAGTPMRTLAVSSAITTFPAVSIAAIAPPERGRAWRVGRHQLGTAVAGATPQRALGLGDRVAQPPSRARRQRTAPAGDVQDRDRLPGHHVTYRDTRADPVVERLAPVLRAPDQHRAVRLESSAHAVRARRRLGPAEPGRQVGLGGPGERGRVSPLDQDAARGIGDGDDAADAATSWATEAARKPRSANTTSCSGVWSISATATGASVRCGSTRYCSRQRCQEIATSGRTPGTWSSPCTNRSQAASTVPLAGLPADMGSSRCTSVMVENRLWSIRHLHHREARRPKSRLQTKKNVSASTA